MQIFYLFFKITRMIRITYTAEVTNNNCSGKVHESRTPYFTIRKRQPSLFGHIVRRNAPENIENSAVEEADVDRENVHHRVFFLDVLQKAGACHVCRSDLRHSFISDGRHIQIQRAIGWAKAVFICFTDYSHSIVGRLLH